VQTRRKGSTARVLWRACACIAAIGAAACDDLVPADPATDAGDAWTGDGGADVDLTDGLDAPADIGRDDGDTHEASGPDGGRPHDAADDGADAQPDVVVDVAVDATGDTLADTDDADAVDPFDDGRTPVHVRFDPSGADFFDMPWPHDVRRQPNGAPDLASFPTGGVDLVALYVETVEANIDGFSSWPVVYIALDAPIAPDTWPAAPDTLAPTSTVQLVRIDDAGCGERVPVLVDQYLDDDPYLPANTLRVSPAEGFFLPPASIWAVVLTRELGRGSNQRIVSPARMRAALAGASGDAVLDASYVSAARCLPAAGVGLDDIALAVPLTTQDAVGQLQRLADSVIDGPAPAAPELTRWADASREGVEVWRGTFEAPIYQDGTPPYLGTGGRIPFAADGTPPAAQRVESIPFSISWPSEAEGPLPVLVWMDGTGFSLERAVSGVVFAEAIERGFAVVSFLPQFHPGRGSPPPDVALATYNYFNPDAGRDNFRQQVAETLALVRMLQAHADGLEGVPELDTDRLVYGGHSQGGQVGSMLAGVTDVFDAYVLNGVGATLSITVIERRDPVDIAALIRTVLGITGTFDVRHPIVQLVQMAGDVAEPGNYARRWRGSEAHADGNDVLVIVGDRDVTTSVASMNSLLVAAGVPPIDPAGWDPDPLGLSELVGLAPPFEANALARSGLPITLAAFLSEGGPHAAMQVRRELLDMAGLFWATGAGDDSPRVELELP
jgi:hypothetical protein